MADNDVVAVVSRMGLLDEPAVADTGVRSEDESGFTFGGKLTFSATARERPVCPYP
jgi:hypothetical protein